MILVSEAIKLIHQRISQISEITLSELQILESIIKIEEYAPGNHFVKPGDSSQKIALLLKGLAKTYYITESGKEHITHFGSEGSFLGAYTDMLKGVPSTGYIETLEPSIMLVMNYKELLEATKNSLAWAHLLRRNAESRYIYRSEKDRNITLKTAGEKYEYFINTHKDLVDRLPQNQIALYLNITAATLSRLKNGSGNYKNK